MQSDNNYYIFMEVLRFIGWLYILYKVLRNYKTLPIKIFWGILIFVIMCGYAIVDEVLKNHFEIAQVKSFAWYPMHFTGIWLLDKVITLGVQFNIILKTKQKP